MRLLVTDEPKDDLGFDVIQMSTAEFNDKRCHLFIASHDFDAIVIELSDKLQLNRIKPVMGTTCIIPKIPAELTSHTISILCEIYPEMAAKLRYTFIRDKNGIAKLLEDMKTQFHWDDFYI